LARDLVDELLRVVAEAQTRGDDAADLAAESAELSRKTDGGILAGIRGRRR
jgi:hypothetical protein